MKINPDLKISYSKKEQDYVIDHSGHKYDSEGRIVRHGGTKRDANMLYDLFFHAKGVCGKTLIQELKDRGYDLTTLKFSVSKYDD